MKTLHACLAMTFVLASLTGCYHCRQSYDPCTGSSYRCSEWGFAKLFGGGCCNRGGCSSDCNDCTTGYGDCAPNCNVPCTDHGPYSSSMSPTPAPTFAPNAPAAGTTPLQAPLTPAPAKAGDETAGWVPSTARHPVHPVNYGY